jgi:RNA polymerase sigma-70 factor (ECF subfamily)
MPGLTADQYLEHRPHLVGVAYRLLGDLAAAEDAVQDAWLRLRERDLADVRDLRAYLTTVVGRLALDQLTSARATRERYVGPWVPEPVVTGAADPADRVTLDESVSLALLVVLESLSPAERTAFVLHDVFGLEFEAVAEVVGRTPAACRQLASRARRHVRDSRPRYTTDAGEHRRAVTAFASATLGGDLGRLMAVLDPGVVWRADGGGLARTARRVVRGADKVARLALGVSERGGQGAEVYAADVNGALGFVLVRDGAVFGVIGFTVAGGRITEVDVVMNPDKLRHLTVPG